MRQRRWLERVLDHASCGIHLSRMEHEDRKAVSLVQVWRGDILEAEHFGDIAIVDSEGNLLASAGNPVEMVTLRSSPKPLQALSIVETGASRAFGLSTKELAVCCASHDGERVHVETIKGMLDRAGLSEDLLACGSHWPYSKPAARELSCTGKQPTALHNNCSGKHTGMLLTAIHSGEDPSGYEEYTHPVQERIRKNLARFTGVHENQMPHAVDGCSVPTYGVPLWRAALAFARFVDPASAPGADGSTKENCGRIVSAIQEFPEMVGGTESNPDTEIMRVAGSRLICKGGAEGLLCVGILPGRVAIGKGKGVGIALKIRDGDKREIREIPMLQILQQLDVLTEEELTSLKQFRRRPMFNHRGLQVGRLSSDFDLLLL